MDTKTNRVSVGCHVVVNILDRAGRKEQLEFDIVPDDLADFENGFLGEGTLLAKEVLGEKAGTVIPYLKDDIYAIEILQVTPSISKPAEDTQEKRQFKLNKAIREVEHTNAVLFASSFSGKWGDYDPDSLPVEENPNTEKTMD